MPEHSNTETLTHDQLADIQRTNISVPRDVYRAVRIAALDRGVSAQDIYVEAVRQYLGDKTKAA
jgi:hypothetical protein